MVKRSYYVEGLRDKLEAEGSIKRKSLLSIAGILRIEVIISSNNISKIYYGSASSLTIKQDFREMITRALQQAIVKHVLEGGNSSPEIKIIDYNIVYLKTPDIRIKREKWKGSYYNVVRNKKTGRIIKRDKYKIPSKYIFD